MSLRLLVPAVLLVVTLLAGVLGMLEMGVWSAQHAVVQAEADLHRQMTHLQSELEYLVAHHDMQQVQLVLASLTGPDIDRAVLLDPNSRCLASQSLPEKGQCADVLLADLGVDAMVSLADLLREALAQKMGRIVPTSDGDFLCAVYPIRFQEDADQIESAPVGALVVRIKLD